MERPGRDYMKRKTDMSETATIEVENAAPGVNAGESGDAGELGAGGVPAISAEEYERVVGERDRLLDRLARLQAEFENARKREARERTEYRDTAVGAAVERMLPVLDNFNLALQAQGGPEQMRAGRGVDCEADGRYVSRTGRRAGRDGGGDV